MGLSKGFGSTDDPIYPDLYKINSGITGYISDIYNNQNIGIGSLSNYLFSEKKCSNCGRPYNTNEITLSTTPGLCDVCKMTGGASLAIQANK